MQDKLLDQTSVMHLFPITKYLGLLATGMTGLHLLTFWSSFCFIILFLVFCLKI